MNIVVLAGGSSTEREVSIVSGQGICTALRRRNHKAVLVDAYFGKESWGEELFPQTYDIDAEVVYMQEKSRELEETVKSRKEFFGPGVLDICKAADMVFLALHGSNGEDGKVQSVFDLMGIPYTGSGPLSSGMAMDKGITKMVFEAKGVPTPKGVTLQKGKCSSELADYDMDFPVIVKPCCGGSSVGVCIAKNQEEYETALEESFPMKMRRLWSSLSRGVSSLWLSWTAKLIRLLRSLRCRDFMIIRTNTRRDPPLRPVRRRFPSH